jgi:hypothetical protein
VRVAVLTTVTVLVTSYVLVTTEADAPLPWVNTTVLVPTDVMRLSPMLLDGCPVVTGLAVETGCMFPFGAGVK